MRKLSIVATIFHKLFAWFLWRGAIVLIGCWLAALEMETVLFLHQKLIKVMRRRLDKTNKDNNKDTGWWKDHLEMIWRPLDEQRCSWYYRCKVDMCFSVERCIYVYIYFNSSCFQFEVESEKPFNALVPRERAEGSFSFKVRLLHNY